MDESRRAGSVIDDDNISVTSTIPDDGEAEWVVSKVLAEKEINEELQYLVEWQGRPLSEADWIPKGELFEDAVAAWEVQKTQQSNGLAPKFQLEEWKTAVKQFVQGKFSRREARNQKRLRLGIPQGEYENTLDSVLAHLDQYLADEEIGDAGNVHPESTLIKQTILGTSPQPLEAPTDVVLQHLDHSAACQEPNGASRLQTPTESPGTTYGKDPSDQLARSANESSRHLSVDLLNANTAKRKETLEIDGRDAKRLRLIIPVQPNNAALLEPHRRCGSLLENDNCKSDSVSTEGTESPASSLRQSAGANGKNQEALAPSIIKPASHMNAKKKRKKKSVRWVDSPQSESAGSRAEDSLFVGDGQPGLSPVEQGIHKIEKHDLQASSPPNRTESATDLSPRDPQQQPETNTRSKPCLLDIKVPDPITLAFDEIAHHTNPWWLPDFDALPCLQFTHTCLAADFQHYDLSVSLREGGSNLIEGGVSPLTDIERMRKRIDLMRVAEMGWLCHRGDYCILVFPTLSEGWRAVNNESAGSAQHPLRYWVFKPTSALDSSLLSPLSVTNGSDEIRLFPGIDKADSRRPFGPEYQDLIPWGSKKIAHHFFLAFPEARAHEAALLSQWLRDSNPECQISTSLAPGQWWHFSNQDHGVVLLHEDAVVAIRRFPDFHKLLHRSGAQHSFWIFSRHLQPLFSSPSISKRPQDFGKTRLLRAFSQGIAMCITPSFLLSQPEQAYELFKWFWHQFVAVKEVYYRGKLVVSARIDEWLYGLISEKSRYRAKAHRMSPRDLRLKGIHDEGMEARSKTWKMLQQLVLESEDTDGPLIFAPESVDGNDEQSLVNWFGWWSILNADKFRKFSVVGSGESNQERLWRQANEPRYVPGTINDPDQCHVEDRTFEQHATNDQSDKQHNEGLERRNSTAQTSRLLANDRPESIEAYMTQILHRIRNTRCPMVLFKKPVSYWNQEMAYHFGDYYSRQYQSYGTFLNFFLPFAKVFPPTASKTYHYGHLFTYAGLFYTLEGKWDAAKFPQDREPVRYPWLAIYRPINAHWKPWKNTELLIWDIASHGRFSRGDEVYESDLSEAQCQLIEAIKNDGKNTDFPLTQVWLGGFETQQTGLTNALDITLDQLDMFAQDIKNRVPLPEEKLTARGWLAVRPGRAPEDRRAIGMRSPTSTAASVEEDLANMKMIFHPPRAPITNHACPSKCTNNLYTWAVEPSRRKKFDQGLYRFLPTVKWYSKQLGEKRGFEHINVTSWESIFETYKIRDPKRDRSVIGGSPPNME